MHMTIPSSKKAQYEQAIQELDAVLVGVEDMTAKMATISCIMKHTMRYYFWVGFYLVSDLTTLKIGPYQGTLACITIPFEKGVCGACASKKSTLIVPDVHAFPGHIACDSKSNSEIVVPVFNKNKELIAVFDVDSIIYDSFDEIDKKYLEQIMQKRF